LSHVIRPGPIVVGRYEIHQEIASGGMATVHFGLQRGAVGFTRTVAIKRLLPALARDPELAAMFLDEARLTMRIRHPNVVSTLDVVASDGELFLVMELVLGESLGGILRELNEPAPPAIATAILVDVLHGLHAAHEATSELGEPLGIVHRDVSPQNVLVGVDGLARVADFGIAKAVNRLQVTRDGQLKGKLAYMAPEQITLGSVDRRLDVFAASIVLWEALVGRRLFHHDEPARVLDAVLRDAIPAPRTLVPNVPEALCAAVLRGLERAPDQRFPTAEEMASALLAATPIATRPQVSAWVASTVGARLATRAEQLRAIESSDASHKEGELIAITGARRAQAAGSSDDADRTQPEHALPAAIQIDANASEPQAMTARETTSEAQVSVATAAQSVPRAKRARWRAPAAIVAAIALVLFGRALARMDAPKPSSAIEPANSASLTATVAPAPSASQAASAAPSASAIAIEAAASASATAATRAPAAKASAPRRAPCRDKFRLDEHGILVPRPECF
jgi:serine/threonine-protein kinase